MTDEKAAPPGATWLTAEKITLISGTAREARGECAVCGKSLGAGQSVVTSLGDERALALGVTLHASCLNIVGRQGVLDLMIEAYRRR